MTNYTRAVSQDWGKKDEEQEIPGDWGNCNSLHSGVLLCGLPLLHIRGDSTGKWMPVEVRYQALWV